MSDLQSLTSLKSKVDKLKLKVERARGVANELAVELKDTWECDSVKAGEELLESLKRKEASSAKKYKEKLEAFEKRWAKELSDAE